MPGTEGLSRARPSGRAHQAPSPGPCFVTAEHDGARYTLLDLASARVTALAASAAALPDLVARLVTEVGSGRWSPPRQVEAAGFDPCPQGARPVTLAQLQGNDAGPEPRLVLLGPRCRNRRGSTELVSAAASGNGAPVVVCWDLDAAGGRLAGDPGLRTDTADALAPGDDEPENVVEVAILGPVEIRASAEPLASRPRLTGLVVYLALHPEGPTTAALTTALWPDRRVPGQTIANRLSEARRALGVAPDGRPRLRRSGDRHHLVAVRTDWTAFQALADHSRGPDAWRRALELVRGRPLEGLGECRWCHLDGLVNEIEVAVADCALALGRERLRAKDIERARWAALRGLRACPFDERLHRILMRAADAAGNRGGVEEAFRQLALVLEIDGDPRLGVHPQTAALYDRLSGNSALG